MKKGISVFLRILLCVIAEFLLFWFKLPAINLKSKDFIFFVIESIILCSVIIAISAVIAFLKGFNRTKIAPDFKSSIKNAGLPFKIIAGVVVALVVFTISMDAIGAKIFNAKSYASLIEITEGDFSEDVAEIKMSQIPVVDRDVASRLGKRELGKITDLVSQFEIEEDYTQINYKGNPYRVTPLKYADFIKWFSNQKSGIPAYITVNLTTQEADLVTLEKPIKYSRSEYFMRNIDRYLRFQHPTKIFAEVSFEIDDNGVPYWVASVVDFKIGYWSGRDICGVVLVNAQTGENKYYKTGDIPSWVDQAFDSDMIMEQLHLNGLYGDGFFNSILSQKNCTQPTDGYNYLAIADDVWAYTGITSITEDESNLGFILSNLRTKETKYYTQAGAEEYSAMESAEGQVQHLGYEATFPILLNIADRPTYFVSLKDDAGLVKMYAFVDMEQYHVVGIGATVDKAKEAYAEALSGENIETPEEESTPEILYEANGTVSALSSAVVNGNTQYYIKLGGDNIYVIPASVSDNLPFLKVGDRVSFSWNAKNEYLSFSIVNE